MVHTFRPRRMLAILAFYTVLCDLDQSFGVEATFRGAKPKAIPSLANEFSDIKGAGQQQSIKISKTAKTPKRTKSGLLPWWVRKRLQEKSEGKPESGGTQRRSRKPKKKALPKHVQVLRLGEGEKDEPAIDIGDGIEKSDSAIIVRDLPLESEGEGRDTADDRVAAIDAEIAVMAETAKLQELSRGAAAEPDVLTDAVAERGQTAEPVRDTKDLSSGGDSGIGGDLDEDDPNDDDEDSDEPEQELDLEQFFGGGEYDENGETASTRRALLAEYEANELEPGMVSIAADENELLPAEEVELGIQQGSSLVAAAKSAKQRRGRARGSRRGKSKVVEETEEQSENWTDSLLSGIKMEGSDADVARREAFETDQGSSEEAAGSLREAGGSQKRKGRRKKRGRKRMSAVAKRAAEQAAGEAAASAEGDVSEEQAEVSSREKEKNRAGKRRKGRRHVPRLGRGKEKTPAE